MDLFNDYEENFKSILSGASQSISGATYSTPDAKRATGTKATKALKEAETLLQTMDVQARSVDPSYRKTCQEKCKTYKASLKSVKGDLDRMLEGADRLDLLSGGNGMELTSKDQEKRLLQTTDKLRAGTATLEDSRRVLAETEEVAQGISSELAKNRGTILSSMSKVSDVGAIMGRARRVINNMDKRERNQKMAIGALILLLFIAVVLIFYFMFKSSDTTGTPTSAPTVAPSVIPTTVRLLRRLN